MSSTNIASSPDPRNSPLAFRELVAQVTAANRAAHAALPPLPQCERVEVIANQTFRCQLYAGHRGLCRHSYPEVK